MNNDNLFEQFANITKAYAYDIISPQVQELTIENNKLKELERSFYMAICRAYNAGKDNMAQCVKSGIDNDDTLTPFISSHDYFVSEFPTFKTNVP